MNDSNLLPDSLIDAARADIVGIIESYIELMPKGAEYEACCPFHDEKTPSFTVTPSKGMFYCFGCAAGGNAIDFVMKLTGLTFREAVISITGNRPAEYTHVPRPAPAPVVEWETVYPVPEGVEPPTDTFWRKKGDKFEQLTASKRWAYLDANNELIGYVCRFELPGGGKDVIPQTYCLNKQTGETRWRWGSFPKPRPLYGLNKLAQFTNAQVIMVEGEKAADLGQQLLIDQGIPMTAAITVSWPGGSKAIPYTDFSPLNGRRVGLWPDADQKRFVDGHPQAGEQMPFMLQIGTQAMMAIFERIKDSAMQPVKFIVPPAGVPCGWDIADADSSFDLRAHLKNNSMPAAEVAARFPFDQALADNAAESVPADAPAAAQADVDQQDSPPWAPLDGGDDVVDTGAHDDDQLTRDAGFTILGYNYTDYYLFHHGKKQVMTINKANISDIGLIELAEPAFWESHFPNSNGGIDKKAIANWIFSTAHARGIYDESRVRGRGAWIDKGRAVFHHGGHLTVDGQYMPITAMQSGYVYPMAHGLTTDAEPLTDAEGRRLFEVADMVRWSMPASAALLAGWTMLAPICGALNWRPHIWILGAAGSGKSTVQAKFVGALTRDVAVYAQGDSTEPGIRQHLKYDALPVLIDELESNNEQDRRRTESIVGMVRKTSSESWAKTLKGSAGGDALHFQIRSMFCLASINANMPTKADIDRLTRLNVRPPEKDKTKADAHWFALEAELNRIDADDTISSRLLARALTLMPVILQNIKTFRRVAAVHFGTQRDGDQFGTLLAGCWSLFNSEPATEDKARAILSSLDFNEHTEDHDQDDAQAALEAVLGAKIRINGTDYTIYELVRETAPGAAHANVGAVIAEQTLVRHGVRVEYSEHDYPELWIGYGVSNLQNLIKDKSFVTDLRGQLLRINGARRIAPKKFNGTLTRSIGIPLKPILED